jgi:hypothetical protein
MEPTSVNLKVKKKILFLFPLSAKLERVLQVLTIPKKDSVKSQYKRILLMSIAAWLERDSLTS